MPLRVYAKSSAEISYPRLHLYDKEAKKTSLTSGLTSCKSKTITQTFMLHVCFHVRSVAAGSRSLVYKVVIEVRSNYKLFYTCRDLGISLVVIQLGVRGILYQSDYLTNILPNIFLVFMEGVRQIIFNQHLHSCQTAPTCWANIVMQFLPIYKLMNTRYYH